MSRGRGERWGEGRGERVSVRGEGCGGGDCGL